MTGRILSVALDPADRGLTRRHQTVLASLPGRFRITANSPADVQLVSGGRDGWQQRARSVIHSGAAAIMFSGTSLMTAEALVSLCEETAKAGVLTAADTAYASARSWTNALPALTADLADCAVLDSIATVPVPNPGTAARIALRTAMTEQLALLRPLLGDLSGLTPVHAGTREYILGGTVRELVVTLSGAVSTAAGHGLDLALVGAGRRWHAHFAADAVATPARISVWDGAGERVLPQVYESGHREAWLGLHRAICQQAHLVYDAGQLASDLAIVESALPLTEATEPATE